MDIMFITTFRTFDMNILCNGGDNPTGYEEKNLISLSFDYVQLLIRQQIILR